MTSYEHGHSTYEVREPGPDDPSLQAPSVEQVIGPPPGAPPAQLTSLSPSSIVAGAGPVPVIVTGGGFTPAAAVWADEEEQATRFVNDTELGYDAQADLAGSQTVTVRDPSGTSNAIELAVT